MIDIEKIFNECKELLRGINIPIEEDDKLSIDLTLKSGSLAEGYCILTKENKYIIQLKKSYVIHKFPDIKHLKSVIMHELVHTVPGCFVGITARSHNAKFLSYANKIRKLLDINIMEFENLSSYICGNKPIKVIGKCDFCGCSFIYRSDKDINKDYYAKWLDRYKCISRDCPYCHSKILLKNVNK